jgi:opacity protein-like surface antigen
MNRYRLLTGIALVGSLALLPAIAPAADSGAYLGGGAGYYRLNDDDFLDENNRFKDNRWAWKAHGGAQFNEVLSLEGGYMDLGKLSDGTLRLEADGWFVAGMAHLPITPRFAPYAKIGNLFWDVSASSPLGSASRSGNDLFYGAGMRFRVTEALQMRVEYDRMKIDNCDVDIGSVNLQYHF